MTQQPVLFDDGEAYDRAMGPWSQRVGEVFLDWLASQLGPRWIDIGWHVKIWRFDPAPVTLALAASYIQRIRSA